MHGVIYAMHILFFRILIFLYILFMSSDLIKINTDNTSETVSDNKYQELLDDYRNMKSRYENEKLEIKRKAKTEFFVDIIMPLYQDVTRMVSYTHDHDMSLVRDYIRQEISYAEYELMDEQYFKKYNNNQQRPDIDTVAEVVHIKNTKEPAKNNLVSGIFKIGLYDKVKDKVVLFPKVSIFIYE